MTTATPAKDWATFLASSPNRLGQLGKGIFYNAQPEQPDECLSVFEFAGPPSSQSHGGIAFKRFNIQIQSRGKPTDSDKAQERAVKAYDKIVGVKEYTIDGRTYAWITDTLQVGLLNRDRNDRPIFYFEVKTWLRIS